MLTRIVSIVLLITVVTVALAGCETRQETARTRYAEPNGIERDMTYQTTLTPSPPATNGQEFRYDVDQPGR